MKLTALQQDILDGKRGEGAALAIVACIIEIAGQSGFLSLFKNFILFLCYFLVPWTAINLLDFYFLRHGKYSTDDMFDDKGIYGRFNWITLIAYVVAILVQIPFMNTDPFYVGPLCNALGGADISWVFGLIIPVFLYYLPMKRKLRKLGQIE